MTNFFYVLALKDRTEEKIVKGKIYTAYNGVYEHYTEYYIINDINQIMTFQLPAFKLNFKILDIEMFDSNNPRYVYNNLILKESENVGGGETQIEPKKSKKENKTTLPKIRSSQSSSLKNYFITK